MVEMMKRSLSTKSVFNPSLKTLSDYVSERVFLFYEKKLTSYCSSTQRRISAICSFKAA